MPNPGQFSFKLGDDQRPVAASPAWRIYFFVGSTLKLEAPVVVLMSSGFGSGAGFSGSVTAGGLPQPETDNETRQTVAENASSMIGRIIETIPGQAEQNI